MITQGPQASLQMPRGWGEASSKPTSSLKPLSPVEKSPVVPPKESMPKADKLAEPKKPSFNLRRILPILLALVVLAAVGFGIYKFFINRSSPSTPGGKSQAVTLEYWGLWESEEVMAGVIAEWEESHPGIKINYQQQLPSEYRERLQSSLARGSGPDIFRYHLTWQPMFKDELSPLPTSVMGGGDFEAAFYPIVVSQLRHQGQYLGIPLGVDNLVLLYNKSILQSAGKTPPTTWDEFRRLAIELTSPPPGQGPIQIAGAAMGLTSNVDHWSDILGLMMLQNGADLTQPTGSLAEDALSFFTLFKRVDQVWDDTLPPSTFAFAGGKLAMYFGYSWDVFEIKRLNPNLDFGIVSVPQLSTDKRVEWASFWVEGVSKKSENSDEAWQFLNYLSSEVTLQKLYQTASQSRLIGQIFPRQSMADLLKSSELTRPFVEAQPYAQTWYLCSATHDNGLNDRMIKYFEDAVNAVVINGQQPQTALTTASQGVAQLLSQYGLASRVAY